MVGCSISRRHKSCYAQSRPRHRTRCRRTPVRRGPRRLPPTPPSICRPGSLDITAPCGQGKLRDRHRPCDVPPDLAPVRGRGRVPARRQPARHGSRRAERSAAFGDSRGVAYASLVRIEGWLCNGIMAAHALQVSRPMLALLELLVGLIDVAGLLIDAADFVVRLFRKRDS